MNKLKKKIISDSFFLAGGDLLLRLKGIVFIPFIVHFIGLDNYGAFIQIIINDQIVAPLATLALGLAFIRYTFGFENHEVDNISRDYWSVIWISLIVSILGAALVYFLAPVISTHILKGRALDSLRLASLLVITGCLSSQNDKFISARRHMKLFSIYQIFYGLVPYLGLLLGISLGSDLYYGMVFYIIGEAFVVFVLMLWIIRQVKFVAPDIKRFAKFFDYSWSLVFTQISGGILSKVDRYFIGYYCGPAEIGIYNIIYSVCSFICSFNIPFVKYFGVYLSKEWDKGEFGKVLQQLREGLIYYLIISIGVLGGMTFLLKPLVKLLVKKDLAYISNIEGLILITGLGVVLWGATTFFNQVIKYKENNRMQLAFQSIAAILNILLNFYFVKKYGIFGAGVTTFLSYLVVLIMANVYLDLGLDYGFFKQVLKIIMASIISMTWFSHNSINSLIELMFNIIIGFAIYLFLIFISRAVTPHELKRRFT